jgi:hypothetical protein
VKIAPVVEVKTVPFFVHSNAPVVDGVVVVVTIIGGALIVVVGVCLDEDM